jgi:hypothetical protein
VFIIWEPTASGSYRISTSKLPDAGFVFQKDEIRLIPEGDGRRTTDVHVVGKKVFFTLWNPADDSRMLYVAQLNENCVSL